MTKAISILIVTYNASQTIRDTLVSLDKQTFGNFEVILLDNCSKDKTVEVVESTIKEVSFSIKTIYSKENHGFAGGNNLALESTTGKEVALLNPDAKVSSGWLQGLTAAMESNPKVGICASKILTWDGSRIDSAGDMMLSTFRAFKRESEDSGMYSCQEYVFGACACAALYRRSMIEEIGFFDEDFFLQCEDSDLNFRAQLAGWKVLYIPKAVVYHKVSHSIGKSSDIGVYYSQRNMELLKVKNVPAVVLLTYIPQIVFGYIVDFLYFGIRQKRYKSFIRAKIDALMMLSLMLRKRKDILGRIKKVDNADIRSLITPFSKNRRFVSMQLKKFLLRT